TLKARRGGRPGAGDFTAIFMMATCFEWHCSTKCNGGGGSPGRSCKGMWALADCPERATPPLRGGRNSGMVVPTPRLLLRRSLHHVALVHRLAHMLDHMIGDDRVRLRGRMDGATVQPGPDRLQDIEQRQPFTVSIGRKERIVRRAEQSPVPRIGQ